MADSKITALTSIGTSTDPANDPLVIVDVSDTSMAASGTTKKVTLNNLLAASGTATLASATITGDLTVRTTGLTVNSSGVGVGLTAALGAGNIQIGAGKYLGYSASAYITPEDNVQGARIKADNILIDGNTSTKWNIGGSTAMTLNSTGLGVGVTPIAGRGAIQLSAGVGFPATQVASSDANTLDDYEEGTWTIGLTFGGGSTGITTGANTGRYTKVGRQVTVIGYLSLTNKGSSTGAANITGLPFASPNNVDSFSAVSLRLDVISYTGTPQGLQLINSTKIELEKLSEAGVSSALTDANFSNTSSIMLESTYFV